VDSFGLRQGPVVSSCEHGSKPSGSTNDRDFFIYSLLVERLLMSRKSSSPWSCGVSWGAEFGEFTRIELTQYRIR
jgi:hypothetical protein